MFKWLSAWRKFKWVPALRKVEGEKIETFSLSPFPCLPITSAPHLIQKVIHNLPLSKSWAHAYKTLSNTLESNVSTQLCISVGRIPVKFPSSPYNCHSRGAFCHAGGVPLKLGEIWVTFIAMGGNFIVIWVAGIGVKDMAHFCTRTKTRGQALKELQSRPFLHQNQNQETCNKLSRKLVKRLPPVKKQLHLIWFHCNLTNTHLQDQETCKNLSIWEGEEDLTCLKNQLDPIRFLVESSSTPRDWHTHLVSSPGVIRVIRKMITKKNMIGWSGWSGWSTLFSWSGWSGWLGWSGWSGW